MNETAFSQKMPVLLMGDNTKSWVKRECCINMARDQTHTHAQEVYDYRNVNYLP